MRIIVVGFAFVTLCAAAAAYEIDTHSRITYEAYFRSEARTPETLRRIGLSKSRLSVLNATAGLSDHRFHLGQKYYDPLRVGGPDRYATAFDAENSWVMKAYRASKPQRRWFYSQFDGRDEPYFPVDWMARGVIYGMIAV